MQILEGGGGTHPFLKALCVCVYSYDSYCVVDMDTYERPIWSLWRLH